MVLFLPEQFPHLNSATAHTSVSHVLSHHHQYFCCGVAVVSVVLTFLSPITGKIAGVIHMIVKRGKNAYQYQSSRVNGEVKTVYQRKVSTQELQEHEKRKKETQQYRQREQDLTQLQQAVNQALSALDMMKRAQLLTIGLYTRRSEIRTLQKEVLCHTTMN